MGKTTTNYSNLNKKRDEKSHVPGFLIVRVPTVSILLSHFRHGGLQTKPVLVKWENLFQRGLLPYIIHIDAICIHYIHIYHRNP